MLVKVNHLQESENKVSVTLLDIDDLGSVVPMKDLVLNVLPYDDSIIDKMKTSNHVMIFTEDIDNNPTTIISAINFTDEELNNEKERMIKAVNKESSNF
ncbi:hypothetical protein [Candidatus Nitrosocosmicus sp. FF01]|uniref:hypothetical protein n=1 Tax=Candidatus Nitrosocosmicus sp. FF01 TaxID=3397670 RepID=UPI0039E77348